MSALNETKFTAFFNEIRTQVFEDQDDATCAQVAEIFRKSMISHGICLNTPAVTVTASVSSASAPTSVRKGSSAKGKLNGYTMFAKTRRAELKASNTTGDLTTMIANEWKAFDDAGKAPWKVLADKHNSEQLATATTSVTGVVPTIDTAIKAKRKPSAYNEFIKKECAAINAEPNNAFKGKEVMMEAVRRYNLQKAANATVTATN